MKPTKHSFRGIEYRIAWRAPKGQAKHVCGTCDSPGAKHPTIEIHPGIKGGIKLNVLIDEAIHAVAFDLDNESVAEMSESIALFLWKCGLRFMEEGQD